MAKDDSSDDLWGDSSDDGQPGVDHRELDREAAARHQQFYNAGYRDALEEGKERTLQQGFDIGFREGAAAGFEWGLLRGAAATLAALDGQAGATRGLHEQVKALQAAADVPPRAAMLATFRHMLSSPMPLPPPCGQQQQQGEQSQQEQDAQEELEALGSGRDGGCAASTAGNGGCCGADSRHDTGADAGSSGGTEGLEGRGGAGCACSGASGGGGADGADAGAGGDLEDALAELTVSSKAEAATTAATGQTGAPGTQLPPYTLPPDAAALELPDIVRLQGELRSRLAGMGFDVGAAPAQPQSQLQARRQ